MKIFIDKPKSAAENINTSYNLIKNKMYNLIRIFSYDKEYVIVGYHQDVEREIRLDYLDRENIGIAKHIASGQSVFVDKDTIGIEYIIPNDHKESINQKVANIIYSLILALKDIGIKAHIDGNHIKVNSKRLASIQALFEKEFILINIFIPLSINIEKTLKSIHMPVEKLTSKGIKSADDRLESIRKAINQDISKETVINGIVNTFYSFYDNLEIISNIREIEYKKDIYSKDFLYKDSKQKDGYIYGLYRCKGATFRVYLKEENNKIKDIFINGDYILYPNDFIKYLENAIINTDTKNIEEVLDEFLKKNDFDGLCISKKDIKEAIMFAIRKLEGEAIGIPKEYLNNIIASIGGGLIENINKAKILLLPYCAKPRWCDYRHLDDCGECGGCSIGDAYRLAYQKGMIPMTITSFELLRDTLIWCADNGYTYIGHCCYEFYEKRYEAFQKASSFGANGVLFDIIGTTCYNLGVEEEEKAYHGEFQVELDLIKDDMIKYMDIKIDTNNNHSKNKQHFDFSEYFLDFRPSYYKKPKAVPTPEEDRTRTAMQKDVFKGEATIKDSVVSYEEALSHLAKLIKQSKNPTVVIGPLLFWDFGEKDLQDKALMTKKLIEKIKNVNVKILPDYRPKLKNYDPRLEMDPPNPHESILHTDNDITILIGTHCYRTDFIIRLLKKHTSTTVVALCGLYGHIEADLSTSFTDADKIEKLTKML